MKERLMESSDKIQMVVCNTCGFIAEKAAPEGTLTVNHTAHYCRFCDSNENIFPVEIPNASKLLLNEITALHLAPRLEIE